MSATSRSGLSTKVSLLASMRLRLLPVVLFGLCCLLALKAIDLAAHGLGSGRALAAESAEHAAEPEGDAEQPAEEAKAAVEGTPAKEGEGGEAPEDAKAGEAKPADPKAGGKPAATPTSVALQPSLIAPDSYSPSERELLARLQQRREQIDQRGQELDTREGLLKAAEKRVEDRIAELKRLEASLSAQDAKRGEADTARLKGVVTMYEAMKAKDAARVFNGLDMTVLLSVVSAMKPQKVSDVLAAMDPAVAQRLTVVLATRQQTDPAGAGRPALDLPQIQGRPSGG